MRDVGECLGIDVATDHLSLEPAEMQLHAEFFQQASVSTSRIKDPDRAAAGPVVEVADGVDVGKNVADQQVDQIRRCVVQAESLAQRLRVGHACSVRW